MRTILIPVLMSVFMFSLSTAFPISSITDEKNQAILDGLFNYLSASSSSISKDESKDYSSSFSRKSHDSTETVKIVIHRHSTETHKHSHKSNSNSHKNRIHNYAREKIC